MASQFICATQDRASGKVGRNVSTTTVPYAAIGTARGLLKTAVQTVSR